MREAYISPTIEPMLTMSPRLREAMCGTTDLQTRRTERQLVSKAEATPSIGRSNSGPEHQSASRETALQEQCCDAPWHITPALLTTMSMRPSRSSTVATTAWILASEVMSRVSRSMPGWANPSIASSLRAVAYTLHPFDANSSHL